jgi:DNA-directed RNA polymerase specialized sigma subunit
MVLTPAQASALARAWALGDRKAGDTLVRHLMPLVTAIARDFASLEEEDATQIGLLAITRAIPKYRRERGDLYTWVGQVVINALTDEVR